MLRRKRKTETLDDLTDRLIADTADRLNRQK